MLENVGEVVGESLVMTGHPSQVSKETCGLVVSSKEEVAKQLKLREGDSTLGRRVYSLFI